MDLGTERALSRLGVTRYCTRHGMAWLTRLPVLQGLLACHEVTWYIFNPDEN